VAYFPHDPDDDFGLKLNRWLGRKDRQLALELPHALYTMELMLASGAGTEEAILYVARGDYGPVSKLFAEAVDSAAEGEVQLSKALLAVGRASGSEPFQEAMDELVARMETGYDVGKRLGQFAYRNQLYIRRANDAFSNRFREVYLPAYMILALLFPFLFGSVSFFLGSVAVGDVPPPPPWLAWPFPFVSLAVACYMIHASPPMERTSLRELYLFMVRYPSTQVLMMGLAVVISFYVGWLSLGFGFASAIITSPGFLILALLVFDHYGNQKAEEVESRFRQGLEDTADYISGHHSLEWSINQGFSEEFLTDLCLVRDRWELNEAFRDLARRFPLHTFRRTALLIKASTERGLEVGDALRMLAKGLWEHHLIRFRRREQNLKELLLGIIIMLGVAGLLPIGFTFLPTALAIVGLVGYLLVYLVGVGRL